MYTAKHAMLYQHKVHNGESYVFYMDIRAGGKNYEEFVRRAIEEDGVNYIRGCGIWTSILEGERRRCRRSSRDTLFLFIAILKEVKNTR